MREAAEAIREFERIAAEAGLRAPSAPDAAAGAAIEAIRRVDADAVDARYLDAFISTRQAAIDELERYVQTGGNPDLRAWASEELPRLRARLQEADLLRQSVNVAPG
jgi:predicted outer membrane protein